MIVFGHIIILTDLTVDHLFDDYTPTNVQVIFLCLLSAQVSRFVNQRVLLLVPKDRMKIWQGDFHAQTLSSSDLWT